MRAPMHPVKNTSGTPLVDTAAPAGGAAASLTYEPFYGLREKPFSLSADPRFLFRSPSHAPAFDALLAGIRRREGLIVLTGEIGTGKTTLCRSVLQHLDQRTFSAFVPDPFVSREDLLKTLLVDFGVISIADLTRGQFNGASRTNLSYPLYEFLDSLVPLQAFAVLVIDEAQNLSLPLLEEIRILSELERREKLLQVVMVGQPELRSNLKLPQMRQADQRVSVRCELKELDARGTAGYVNHRLGVAGGGENRAEFTPDALEAVHYGSSGVPRLINRICDRALERAYAPRSLRIDAHFVWEAIDDLGLSPSPRVHDPGTDAATTAPAGVGQPIVETPIQFPAPALKPLALVSTQTEAARPPLWQTSHRRPSNPRNDPRRPPARSRGSRGWPESPRPSWRSRRLSVELRGICTRRPCRPASRRRCCHRVRPARRPSRRTLCPSRIQPSPSRCRAMAVHLEPARFPQQPVATQSWWPRSRIEPARSVSSRS